MKPHPLIARIDSAIPKVEKLGNAIRSELRSLLLDLRANLETLQANRSRAGLAAKGNSGRPRKKPPAEAVPFLSQIAAGTMKAYRASEILRETYPDHECRFSAGLLTRWANETGASE